MKPSKTFLVYACTLSLTCAWSAAHAQQLYKYVDANGKVTYSDRKPKTGEKATPLNVDGNANLITVPLAARAPAQGEKTAAAGGAGGAKPPTPTEILESNVAKAEADLEVAKKALEDGRQPNEDERRIRVGMKTIKGKDGKSVSVPSGENAVMTTEAYAERIATLEAGVKTAEANLDAAKDALRRAR